MNFPAANKQKKWAFPGVWSRQPKPDHGTTNTLHRPQFPLWRQHTALAQPAGTAGRVPLKTEQFKMQQQLSEEAHNKKMANQTDPSHARGAGFCQGEGGGL